MSRKTTIAHPIIKSYIDNFIIQHEISNGQAKDEHAIFEYFVNDLILSVYANDPSITYQDMETGTSFGIDGIAMFISDRVVTSIEDVDLIIENLKKFDVSFIFTQAKTSNEFNRTEITDFLT